MRSAELASTELLTLARSRPPTLGTGRLICLDGPAGSGKTTLAESLAALAPGSRVVHMDDLYDGWGGLPRVADQLDSLLGPLARGEPGSYRRYDWLAGAFAETVAVEPGDLVILEGVGSGSRAHADLITVLAWVEAPAALRMRRGIERDGEAFAQQWEAWAEAEASHFEAEQTRARADLRIETG